MNNKNLISSLLAVLLLPLMILSCAKGDALSADDESESLLTITGSVREMDGSEPIAGISVTLLSYLPEDELRDNPVASETVVSASNGSFHIGNKFNVPASSLQHTLQFEDRDKEENGGFFLPFTMPVTLTNPELSYRAGRGYILTGITAFLNKAE